MKYQIRWRVKGETTEQTGTPVFRNRLSAQIFCDEANDLHAGAVEHWVVEVMEGPFVKDGDTIIPNPIKE
jgi:hypothetical protein